MVFRDSAKQSPSSMRSIEEFTGRSYDYIIVGGGTAGLVLARRLSSDPEIEVAVIEAGKNRLDDPLVDIPGMHPQMLGNDEYEWNFRTTPQVRFSPPT